MRFHLKPGGAWLRASATYTKDVAPILFERCAPCHYPGGSAPFSVLDYETVKSHARQIVAATRSRLMPPVLPNRVTAVFQANGGSQKIASTHRRWWIWACPRENRTDLPPPPRFSGGWQLGEPDLVVKLPQTLSLRAGGEDVWRNFRDPVPISEPRYVKRWRSARKRPLRSSRADGDR